MAEKSRNADFDKTVKTKKKEKRNGRAFTIFAILVLLLLGTYFCMTKLFVFKNLKIVSEGKEHYTEQQILEGAGINKGVLLHELDIKSAEYKASYNLPYVDITFKKRFPTTLVANVKYRQPKFYINVANSMYVLSEDLVVLEKTADIEMIEANALVFVEFSDINKCIEGEKIFLEDEIKEIFESLVFELDSAGMLGRISGINMKNKY